MRILDKVRSWFSAPAAASRDAQQQARRLRDDQLTIRASQTSGGTPFLSGSGATNPAPTPDVLDPGDERR